MKNKNKVKMFLRAIFTNLGQATTDNGMVIYWEGDGELEVGTKVYQEVSDVDEIDYEEFPTGEYIVNGVTVTVEGGVVTNVATKEEEEIEQSIIENEEVKNEFENLEAEHEELADETAEQVPEVENPTNTGEESDTEAIVEIRKEINELFALYRELLDKVDKIVETPVELSADVRIKEAPVEKKSKAMIMASYLGK